MNRDIAFTTVHGRLAGQVSLPPAPRGLVVIAHLQPGPEAGGVTAAAVDSGLAVFSLELLTAQELHFPDTAHNVPLLTERLLHGLEIAGRDADTGGLPVGIFADAPVAPAAIRTAARRDSQVRALVCHGGVIDLAGLQYLELLAAPLLMLIDCDDTLADAAFHRASPHLTAAYATAVLAPGESPAGRAAAWFARHLGST